MSSLKERIQQRKQQQRMNYFPHLCLWAILAVQLTIVISEQITNLTFICLVLSGSIDRVCCQFESIPLANDVEIVKEIWKKSCPDIRSFI